MEVSSIGDPMTGSIFVARRKKKPEESWKKFTKEFVSLYEWEEVGKEDFEDGILLEYNGN